MNLRQNPFSSCFIDPSVPQYNESLFSIDDVTARFESGPAIQQIVGDHGIGKTSLTIAIARKMKNSNFCFRWITIRRSNRFSLPTVKHEDYVLAQCPSASQRVLFIDGIERLGFIHRWTMLRTLRRDYSKIVITTHRSLFGISQLIELKSNLEFFRALAGKLYQNDSPDWQSKVEQAFHDQKGNYREAFFQLYDDWEKLSKVRDRF